MNIFRLAITAFLLGAIQASLSGLIQDKVPMLICALAVYMIFHTSENYLVPGLFVSGIIRDLLVGFKLGSSAIAFIVIGTIVLYFAKYLKSKSFAVKLVLAVLSLFLFKVCEIFICIISSEIHFYVPSIESLLYPIFFTVVILYPMFYLFKNLGLVYRVNEY